MHIECMKYKCISCLDLGHILWMSHYAYSNIPESEKYKIFLVLSILDQRHSTCRTHFAGC